MGLVKYRNNKSARLYNQKFSDYCCSPLYALIWSIVISFVAAMIYLFIFKILIMF